MGYPNISKDASNHSNTEFKQEYNYHKKHKIKWWKYFQIKLYIKKSFYSEARHVSAYLNVLFSRVTYKAHYKI